MLSVEWGGVSGAGARDSSAPCVVSLLRPEGSLVSLGRPVLRLSLRKPSAWQWQLSTSASSPTLLPPAVQLYDHRGHLLADTTRRQQPRRHQTLSDGTSTGSSGSSKGARRPRRRHRGSLSSGNETLSSSGERARPLGPLGWPSDAAMAPAASSRLPPPPPHRPPPPCHLQRQPAAQHVTPMGGNTSRQGQGGKGLVGRRTQSSGSLCTADKLGRLLAPCGRHRQHREGRDARYKLCGSLPNHLNSTLQDSDNNNITPASPAVSEKARVLDLQDLGYASERSPDEERIFPGADLSVWRAGVCEAVALQRGSRGLGFSVCGGADCTPDGLVRIKRLFPHQPAWQSGRLRPGDILLAVNGTPLSGLTNHEALELLRTAPDHVVLTVARTARPPSWSAPPPPSPAPTSAPRREPPAPLQPPDPRVLLRQNSCGELEITLTKVHGSLGFTLRKEDSSALGHYVRALVREPALSDGRIRPGDKIVAVNGVDISHMSHEEAVLFLRQAGDSVSLRLYRDVVQTPVSALSPTEAHKLFRPKPLRKEALDMLSDLAVRRMGPGPGDSATLGRLRRAPGPGAAARAESQRVRTQSFNTLHQQDANLDMVGPSHSHVELPSSSSLSSLSSCTGSVVERPRRPDFLDLNGGGRPEWHLQRLTTSPGEEGSLVDDDHWVGDGRLTDFASLPCESASPDRAGNFNHRHPAYQSALPDSRVGRRGDTPSSNHLEGPDLSESDGEVRGGDGCTGLLKWKGVVFTPDDDQETVSSTPQDDTGDETASQSTIEDTNGQVLTVELNRGWNSRLGFSLKSDGSHSLISAIYSDSVAAKNGKLRIGDRVIMVNDESVEGMETAQVIDLFRKIRGPIAITVWRRTED